MKKLTRERVVPTISANVSWLILRLVSITGVQQDTYGVAAEVRRHQVGCTIAIEVTNGDRV